LFHLFTPVLALADVGGGFAGAADDATVKAGRGEAVEGRDCPRVFELVEGADGRELYPQPAIVEQQDQLVDDLCLLVLGYYLAQLPKGGNGGPADEVRPAVTRPVQGNGHRPFVLQLGEAGESARPDNVVHRVFCES